MSENFLEKNVIDSMVSESKGTILRSIITFTAIELCGSFLTGETGPGNTKNNFLTFCGSKYLPLEYRKINELLYSIFRNGVTHSYVPKGAALLSSETRSQKYHLSFLDKGLFIYVPKLVEDVVKAIRDFLKDLEIDTKLQNNYYKVLRELDKVGKEEYLKFIRKNNIQLLKIPVNGDINVNL